MTHTVYIIECSNGSYYTGYTTDIERRYQEHQQGTRKSRYTRSFPPKKLLATWTFESKSEALCIEYRIKQLSRKEKEKLIQSRHQDDGLDITRLIK